LPDFDPEEDAPALRSDEESGSEESDNGLAGTEHYATVELVVTSLISFIAKFYAGRVSFENQTKSILDPNTLDLE